MQPECERCGRVPHPKCLNGSIITDDSGEYLKSVECPNLKLRRVVDAFHKRVPPSFVKVQMAKHTPLYVPRSSTTEGQDLTDSNLLIMGVPWNPTFISHLKKVFFCKPNLTYQIVTDARIKDVYLGAEAFKGLPESKRKDAHNTLEDLVSESYDLVIVQLGQMLHKNSAAANVLRQALMYRYNAKKPTWLFKSSDPGISWELSRDIEVEEFVNAHYETLDLYESGESRHEVERPNPTDDREEEVPELTEKAFVPDEGLGGSSIVVDDAGVDLEGLMGGSNDKPKWKKNRRRW